MVPRRPWLQDLRLFALLPAVLLIAPREGAALLLIVLGYSCVLFGTGLVGSRRALSVTSAGGLVLISLACGMACVGQPMWVLLAAMFTVAVLSVAVDQGLELGPPGPYYFLILVTMGRVVHILDLASIGWLLAGIAGAIAASMIDLAWSRRHLTQEAVAAAQRCVDAFERDLRKVGSATGRELTERVGAAFELLQQARRPLENCPDRDPAERLQVIEDRFRRLYLNLVQNTLARGTSRPQPEHDGAWSQDLGMWPEPSISYRLRHTLASPSMALVTLARVTSAIVATLVLGELLQTMHPVWATVAVVLCLGTPGSQLELTRRTLAVMAGMLVGLIGYGLLLQLPRSQATLAIVLLVLLIAAVRAPQYGWGVGAICISMSLVALANPGVAAGRQWEVVLDRFFESVIAGVVCLFVIWLTGGWLVGWVVSGNMTALADAIQRTLGTSLGLDGFSNTDPRQARAELAFCLRRSGSAARLTTATSGRSPATLDLEGALARIGVVVFGASLDRSVWPSKELALRVIDQIRHLRNITVADNTPDLRRLNQRVDEILPQRPGISL